MVLSRIRGIFVLFYVNLPVHIGLFLFFSGVFIGTSQPSLFVFFQFIGVGLIPFLNLVDSIGAVVFIEIFIVGAVANLAIVFPPELPAALAKEFQFFLSLALGADFGRDYFLHKEVR
jgi:hypothetical protein